MTQPGQWKNYHYPNDHPACTFWYHDHAVDITAENAYFGLAAQYHIHDPLEQSLGLPGGAYDVPLIIRDAMFANDGSLMFDDDNHSGLFGDVILVNGALAGDAGRAAQVPLPHAQRVDLALLPPAPLDGRAIHGDRRRRRAGPSPQPVADFRFGMAERYEMVIDFSKYPIGQRVVLQNTVAEEQHRIREHRQDHGVRRGRRALDARRQHDPRSAQPRRATMNLTEADAVRTRKFEFVRKHGSGRSTDRPGQT